ncbi:uncharacterized protein [Brachyistius frenatus]|uniref:uncharacterized protein isoform X3 n=1 Tax=Brachyistius frenatus TaxID=100188 RepID=UPI0037E9B34C
MNGEAMEGKPAQEHAGNGSHLPPPPTIVPAIPPYVKLGLTIAYTIFYSLLFAFVYAQLWLVLRYRHKRFSYQTAFLFLCLLWAALRALLFSFYFRDCVTANALGPFAFWLLYCFPVCLQFFTLSLMNLYCAQTSSLPALPGRQSHVPGGESGLRPAGEDGRRRREERGPGHVGVSGGSDRRGGGAAVRVPGLLQPGGARPRRHPDRRLLRLRLVQRVGPGGPALVARRRRLRGVRGDSVRVGAAAHLAGRLLLQGPEAASGPEQRRGPEPRSLLQRILLRQPSSVRQRRRPGVEPSSSELLGQSVLRLLRLGRPPQQLHRPHRQRRAAPDRRRRRAPPLPIIPLFPVQHHFYTVTPITHCVCCFH